MSLSFSPSIIENKILENFIEYQDIFIEFQSNFLINLHKRYQGVENGNLVLYFARLAHQDILRQKDYNLSFNISFENFWENHKLISPIKKSIVRIAEDTALPKETARRKILQLVKQKVLNKKNNNIGWFPNEQYKESYNLVVKKEITGLSSLLNFVCKKMKITTNKESLEKELKEKFNFYWFHFLNTQLKYLKVWSLQLKDLELALIVLKMVSIFALKAKKKNLPFEKIFNNPSVIKAFGSASISATTVSEVTGIPRATCIRKLEHLVKLKVITQETVSKKYYIIPTIVSKSLIFKQVIHKITNIFSEFYFICLRAHTTKPLN
jgi:hypothetical protein